MSASQRGVSRGMLHLGIPLHLLSLSILWPRGSKWDCVRSEENHAGLGYLAA